MARALQLARRGLYTSDPNPRVGCVIVKAGKVIGEGGHIQAGGPHAEVLALQQAGEQARDATAYVTLEPCCHQGRTGPCTDVLINSGVRRVVVAMEDPNPLVAGQGITRLRQAGIQVVIGIEQAAAEQLNPGFISRMKRGRPFMRCKMAMSLDGRTAMASGQSQWITSAAARQDVQRLRARSSAILTGIGTVLADDPALTVRPEQLFENAELLVNGSIRQPIRIIIDTQARLPGSARLLQHEGEKLLVTSAESGDRARNHLSDINGLSVMSLAVVTAHESDGLVQRLDLGGLFDVLAPYQLNEVLIEAGPTLCGALLTAGYIDELVIYMAPKLMGHLANGLFNLPWLTNMAQCVDVEITDIRAVGHDWRITAALIQ